MPETLGPFNLILLAIPGIGLRLTLRILYGTRSRAASDPLRSVLSLASTLMIIMAVLGSLIALTGPAIVPLAPQFALENFPFEFTVTASDPDGDGLIYSASSLPAGASFNPLTATFSWTPGFTAAAVLALAIGISASASIFTIINAFLFRPLPVDRPNELVSIATLPGQVSSLEPHIAPPDGRIYFEPRS